MSIKLCGCTCCSPLGKPSDSSVQARRSGAERPTPALLPSAGRRGAVALRQPPAGAAERRGRTRDLRGLAPRLALDAARACRAAATDHTHTVCLICAAGPGGQPARDDSDSVRPHTRPSAPVRRPGRHWRPRFSPRPRLGRRGSKASWVRAGLFRLGRNT